MTSPFYSDWTFWSFVVAGVAVLLSQIPPVASWFKKAQLDMDVYGYLFLSHKLGNPNAQLQIALVNTGNRNIKVKEISLAFERSDAEQRVNFVLPGRMYYQVPSDKNQVLLSSFRLATGAEWSHITAFFPFFSRQDERTFRGLANSMQNELTRLRTERPDQQALYEVGEDFLRPYMDFYNAHFKWESGEYNLAVKISTIPEEASLVRRFLFTVFETDTAQLHAMTDDYKYGAGITWEMANKGSGVSIPLREA